MRRFQKGVRTSNVTINEAALEIIAHADKGFWLNSLVNITLAAATASTFGLGRPAAKGVTPTSPAAIPANDGGPDALATTALAWATSPTAPTLFFHRTAFPATIGAQRDWILPEGGIWVPKGQTIVVWNLAANGVSDISFDISE